MSDSNKSPACENIPIINPKNIASVRFSLSGKIKCMSKEIITVKINPVKAPSIVLLGLIAES
jgi:hypothetical protein